LGPPGGAFRDQMKIKKEGRQSAGKREPAKKRGNNQTFVERLPSGTPNHPARADSLEKGKNAVRGPKKETCAKKKNKHCNGCGQIWSSGGEKDSNLKHKKV